MTTEQIQNVTTKALDLYNADQGFEMVICIRLALTLEGFDFKQLTRKESDIIHRNLRKALPEGYAVAM